jgi:hypothetical protein
MLGATFLIFVIFNLSVVNKKIKIFLPISPFSAVACYGRRVGRIGFKDSGIQGFSSKKLCGLPSSLSLTAKTVNSACPVGVLHCTGVRDKYEALLRTISGQPS